MKTHPSIRVRGLDLLKLRMEAGFNSWEKLAVFLDVTKRTVQNWEKTGAPTHVVKFLRLLSQDLSWMGKEWQGWTIAGGEVMEHYGAGYRLGAGELRAFRHIEHAMELGQRKIKELEGRIRELEEAEIRVRELEAEIEPLQAQFRFHDFLSRLVDEELPGQPAGKRRTKPQGKESDAKNRNAGKS